MASLNMGISYDFTNEKIDEKVEAGKIGNYALGYMDDGTFIVKYVGRSDTDLNRRLKEHLGEHPKSYKRFKFSYASSEKAAFEKECENYHDFEPSFNTDHPDQPAGKKYQCPRCKKFEGDK